VAEFAGTKVRTSTWLSELVLSIQERANSSVPVQAKSGRGYSVFVFKGESMGVRVSAARVAISKLWSSTRHDIFVCIQGGVSMW
jgi:hypothetical protein